MRWQNEIYNKFYELGVEEDSSAIESECNFSFEGNRSCCSNNKQLASKLKEGKMSLDEDDENPSSMRNSREKLDLLIEYQTVSEENQGEWLRQHGLHSEHLPLFRQELNGLIAE